MNKKGELKRGLWMIFLISLFFVLFVRGANLNCSIMPSADCAETKILFLENETGGYWNAHAQNASEASYDYTICCDANDLGDTLNTNCDDGTFLKLSDVSNAHVQQPSVDTYSVDACMSAASGDVNCEYVTSCSSGYDCLASMASDGSANNTNAHLGDCDEYDTLICCGLGVAPNAITPILNSSDPTLNRTAQDLECSFIPTDNNPGDLYANITWIKDGIVNSTNSSLSVTNGTQYRGILSSGYTSKGEDWICSVEICDNSSLCNSLVNSSSLSVLNTPPPTPTLTTPEDGNITFDRTPTFTWGSVTDDDGDTVVYNISVECNPACSVDNRQVNDIASAEYTIPTELDYFWDDEDYYLWKVAAYDGEEQSSFSGEWNFSISTEVIISLPDSTINFGSKNIGDTDDTTDDTPSPLTVQNDGNCHIDINLSSDNLLWDTLPAASSNYRYKIDNSSEAGSFNWSSSVTDWTNIPVSNNTVISWFNHTDATDLAEVDILIDVPLDEPTGDKNSMLQFTGYYAKIT